MDLVKLNEGMKELKNENSKFEIRNSKFSVPLVIADFMLAETITAKDLESIGYTYNEATDKWNISDAAADFIYTSNKIIDFGLPGTLKVIVDAASPTPPKQGLLRTSDKYFPLFQGNEFIEMQQYHNATMNFVAINLEEDCSKIIEFCKEDTTIVFCIYAKNINAYKAFANKVTQPIIIAVESMQTTVDLQLIDFSQRAGALFLDNIGNGIWLMNDPTKITNTQSSGRTYLPVSNNHQFLNNTSFSILQATRKRISKTEYISCPSCGRTLFDLQETTAKIRNVTSHLKGLKIAIMGCIVNGPGEMADADFGYVGSGPGKITLYKSKEVVKKNIPSEIAVEELINLLKENGVWVDATGIVN
jgi:(E)-4-hydroxy-3-methylbut-2-enyl-diphosphate synthase